MKWFRRCVAAFRFLTIMPLPGSFGATDEDLAGSPLFFPVVGLVLGLIAGACAWVLWRLVPPPVAAVLLTFILFSFSGALHLDGLADSADGLFSARSRERILVIMRDSRIGAMGVIALVMFLALKISALSVLSRDEAVRAALLIPVSGRCAIVVMMALLPYVRPEGGLGTRFLFAECETGGPGGPAAALRRRFPGHGPAGPACGRCGHGRGGVFCVVLPSEDRRRHGRYAGRGLRVG